jgi:hypothetical protein
MKDGSEQSMEFMRADLDSLQLTPTNSWDFQTSVPWVFSAQAESLLVEYTVVAENVEKVVEPASGSRQITVKLHDTSDQVLASVNGAEVAALGNISKTRHRLAAALETLGLNLVSTPMKINLRIEGFKPKPATYASLGHIYDFTKAASQPFAGLASKESNVVPRTAALFNNYPNPFNPSTTIRYSLPKSIHTIVTIYDMLGTRVRTLVNSLQNAGEHSVIWDGRDDRAKPVASGIYFYRLQAGDLKMQKKMLLLQ